jgi:hypothetical protein
MQTINFRRRGNRIQECEGQEVVVVVNSGSSNSNSSDGGFSTRKWYTAH